MQRIDYRRRCFWIGKPFSSLIKAYFYQENLLTQFKIRIDYPTKKRERVFLNQAKPDSFQSPDTFKMKDNRCFELLINKKMTDSSSIQLHCSLDSKMTEKLILNSKKSFDWHCFIFAKRRNDVTIIQSSNTDFSLNKHPKSTLMCSNFHDH